MPQPIPGELACVHPPEISLAKGYIYPGVQGYLQRIPVSIPHDRMLQPPVHSVKWPSATATGACRRAHKRAAPSAAPQRAPGGSSTPAAYSGGVGAPYQPPSFLRPTLGAPLPLLPPRFLQPPHQPRSTPCPSPNSILMYVYWGTRYSTRRPSRQNGRHRSSWCGFSGARWGGQERAAADARACTLAGGSTKAAPESRSRGGVRRGVTLE